MAAEDAPADEHNHPKVQPSTSTNNHGQESNDKSAKKGKKRKSNKQSREEQYMIESKDRFNKLHHACSKILHKEGKVVKSFFCQKIGKDIKTAQEKEINTKESRNDDDKETEPTSKCLAKTRKRIQKLELKLELTKMFDLSAIVDIGLKRLGVLALDPSINMSEDVNDDKKESKSSSSQADDPFYKDLIESMLRHKRLSSAMDQLNDKVTDFRQWSMRRQQILIGEEDPASADDYTGGKKKKKRIQLDKTNETLVVAGGKRHIRGMNMGGHEGTSGLFIGSLSGMSAEGFDEGSENGEDEDGSYYGFEEQKKKNRPGQRARKAKAMAIEAKKAGKTWDSSVNWREKKKDNAKRDDGKSNEDRRWKKSRRADERHHDNGDSVKPRKAEQIAQMGKFWKEEGNAHPSWAAATAQKSQGIQTFQGKKITFD